MELHATNQFGQLSRSYPQENPASPISIISEELLANIFSFFELKDSLQALSVCRQWRKIIVTPVFLEKIVEAKTAKEAIEED